MNNCNSNIPLIHLQCVCVCVCDIVWWAIFAQYD